MPLWRDIKIPADSTNEMIVITKGIIKAEIMVLKEDIETVVITRETITIAITTSAKDEIMVIEIPMTTRITNPKVMIIIRNDNKTDLETSHFFE
jgi:hypothetical protein